MPRIPTRGVSRECLDALFEERGVWARISEGSLTTEPLERKALPARNYPNSTSEIVKHCTLDGEHIATTHRIVDNADGRVHHWDAKDIVIGGERLYRL